MVEALTELKEQGNDNYTKGDLALLSHPLMAQNYANLTGTCPILVGAVMMDGNVTSILKMLMLISYRIGVKVGRQEVIEEFLPKEGGE